MGKNGTNVFGKNAPEQEMPWVYLTWRNVVNVKKTKWLFIRLVFRRISISTSTPPTPLPLLLCPAPRPFIVFRWGYVNTAKIIYHLSVIRIADRCNLQYCAKCKWRLSYIAQEGVGWGKQTSYMSMSHFSSRNVRKRIDEISELSRDYLKEISI